MCSPATLSGWPPDSNMPLDPGTTLGPYTVTAKIGEGGMGEVCRARDTKLDRDVALKVLPPAFTDDPDRLARFEREAKVLASLNHPNIGHIYGLEEAEGQKALVLELVEGPTLAERITQGPIPVDEALPIANQIAEATMRRDRLLLSAVFLVTLFWCDYAQAQSDIPRTAAGKPDLTGIWDYHHLTPLQRPQEFSDKATLSPEEASVYESNAFNRVRDGRARNPAFVGVDLWHEEALAEWKMDHNRTALITDPVDGRVPPLTERRRAERSAVTRFRGRPRGVEDLSVGARCIVAPQSVPPIMTLIENAVLQIFQTPDHVAILTERMHDSRIVPLGDRPPLPREMTPYMGSSTGHWDGDTLVVETSQIDASYNFQGSSEEMQVVERFTRISRDELHYEFTINDPRSFAQPWTASYDMHRSEAPIIEYACHEGNYGLTNILAGARAEEAREAASGADLRE